MAIVDTIKEKVTDLLPARFQKKQAKSSASSNGVTNDSRYKYAHLENRDIQISYQTVRNLMKDPQIKVGWTILKYFLVSKKYTLTSNSDAPEDIEITTFVQDCLDNMTIPFNTVLKNIFSGIIYSFSVQEKVYKINNDGRIVINAIYPVHIKTLQNNPFVRDKNGEIIAIHQEAELGTIDIPREKVLLYGYDSEFDEIIGHSILEPMKPIHEDKENIKDWLMTFLNRLGSPVMYGKTDSGKNAKEMLKSFEDVAKGTTGMTVNIDDEIGTIETSNKGEAYFNALQYNDNQILRLFFLGNLIMGDGGQTGSYAQSNTQKETLLYILNGILSEAGQEIQSQVINELVTWNFGIDAKAPNLNFDNFIEKDVLALLSALQPYVANGSVDSDNHAFRELIGKVFSKEADIKVDLDSLKDNETLEDSTDFGYQTPLKDTPNPEEIVDNVLEGII